MAADLIEALADSKIYRDYERAFSEATGLPLSLDAIEAWKPPHVGKREQNAFCEEMAAVSCLCAACLRTQEKLKDGARDEARTVKCEFEMLDSAVPVKIGDELIGFLQTGQVFCKKPTAAQFERVAAKLRQLGVPVTSKVEESYFDTRVMSPAQYDAMIHLLSVFAQHLSIVANQIVVQRDNAEAPMIRRAKEFIKSNQADDLSLGQVAKAVNTSTFYFCKMFKKATGLNFTEYLSRVRVEKAKNLLLNPNLRVSEIAYEVGFQSLTHFNRVFKKVVGQSPTEFRGQLASA